MWLISAAPHQLGLDAYESRRCSRPFVPALHGLTSDDVRGTVLERMRVGRLEFRCIWGAPNAEFVERVHGFEGIVPGIYERQTPKRCFAGAERIDAGEPTTFIAFFTPKNCFGCATGPDLPMEMHIHFSGYLAFDDAAPDDVLQYYSCNQYGSWPMTGAYASICRCVIASRSPRDRLVIAS